ncbi:MAG: 30S ribosomal protein S8e [Candidatus Hadarchaeum yellowstonense]|jgi:small subunit ribosomal protein S8e|uniref:Small ribosomal subunit protein eS8 n=1 Tax=Hadarchaeum yellowstonense TaxID=1776334 RepID=A0A147JUZ3_HADYE|nr:MAG: 30S ribosomal protein S8e [Candidatus Hadarchaeum yellowstonense]
MAKWQGRSLRKPSGGRIWPSRHKRKREMGSEFLEPKIGPTKSITLRTFGGGTKKKLLYSDVANVIDPKTGRAQKVKIITVVQNPADMHFVRRNILTRGAIIETELGKARVTSRPGQVGTVEAVLIEPKAEKN